MPGYHIVWKALYLTRFKKGIWHKVEMNPSSLRPTPQKRTAWPDELPRKEYRRPWEDHAPELQGL